MDTTAADIKEKGHSPDKSDTNHCPHCADHGKRLDAVETYLGMKKEPGVSAEEKGKKPRKRH